MGDRLRPLRVVRMDGVWLNRWCAQLSDSGKSFYGFTQASVLRQARRHVSKSRRAELARRISYVKSIDL